MITITQVTTPILQTKGGCFGLGMIATTHFFIKAGSAPVPARAGPVYSNCP